MIRYYGVCSDRGRTYMVLDLAAAGSMEYHLTQVSNEDVIRM